MTLYEPSSFRSQGTLEPQKKARKVGRPKLPKGEAKGRIVPVRFTGNDLRGNGSQGQDERPIVVRMDSEHVECRDSVMSGSNWEHYPCAVKIAVQQKLKRHSDIRTTTILYVDGGTEEMAQAH
jgi:hypothetical protein